MQWYYGIDGQQYGPVSQEELARLAREGKLRPTDYVWNPDFGAEWVRAATVPGLFGASPEAAAAEPGPPPPPGTSYRGTTHNRELMAQARRCLAGNWGLAVGVVILNGVIGFVVSIVPYVGPVLGMLIAGPLALGFMGVFLTLARSRPASSGMLFDGFKYFGVALGAYVLMGLLVFLWSLLLIVPGIIASLRYTMTFFILHDNPGIGPLEAIRRSKQMMHGNKWKYFCLQWRFFWWALLCLLTCGIGFLWLIPYVTTSNAR